MHLKDMISLKKKVYMIQKFIVDRMKMKNSFMIIIIKYLVHVIVIFYHYFKKVVLLILLLMFVLVINCQKQKQKT